MYSQEQRKLQSDFGTEKLAEKLVNMIVKSTLDERERAFLESREMFFLSTVDKEGRPTVSFKGGAAGFLKAIDEKTVVFPSYDGNGMFLRIFQILMEHWIWISPLTLLVLSLVSECSR